MKSFKDTKYGDLTGKTYKGNISVEYEEISSLKGSPKIVDGDYNCSWCAKLKDLKYSPKSIKGDFICNWCENLETLNCDHLSIDGKFICNSCDNLESVEGAPRQCKEFICTGCKKIKTLDPLLRCNIEKVIADSALLDDYKKKKKVVDKHGYDKAMEIFEVLDDLL